jgi:hypothetical protein
LSEKEHSRTFRNSKLFPENPQQMEHSTLLMYPDYFKYSVEPQVGTYCVTDTNWLVTSWLILILKLYFLIERTGHETIVVNKFFSLHFFVPGPCITGSAG